MLIDTLLHSAQQKGLPIREAQLLLRHATGLSRAQLITHSTALPSAQVEQFNHLVKRRLGGEPIAYIVGQKEFFSLSFIVSPATLIPRPETEELVERALALLQAYTTPRILDLGTGSGIIAITLARHLPQATVIATDVSPAALAIATQNAQRLLSATHSLRFYQGSWWAALQSEYLNPPLPAASTPSESFLGSFDLIISNPPYIAAGDHHLTQGDLRFEPRNALTDNSDGLSDLDEIIKKAPLYLKSNGTLLLEHGYDQAPAVQALLKAADFEDVFSANDYASIPRISGGTWRPHNLQTSHVQ